MVSRRRHPVNAPEIINAAFEHEARSGGAKSIRAHGGISNNKPLALRWFWMLFSDIDVLSKRDI